MAKFKFNGLAVEIRLMIYPMVLTQGYENTLPPLLLALWGAGANQQMYDEAFEIYTKLNATITADSVDSCKKLPRSTMMDLRHIKIVWGISEN
jgi:hypothetical protein